ncbi:MAG: MerR family transcriptional regulator [Rhodobacteraceae bacterium]|nr:MAG: MerR family transcriptional regulator [Paracoccaceae bacterium]
MAVSKSEKAFRTITEVADILKLPAHVLRFWESKFKYIKPMKRGGGRRYYRPEDIHLLLGIKYLLYSKGLTIKGAQKTIQTSGVKSVAKLGKENYPRGAQLMEAVIKSSQSIKKLGPRTYLNLSDARLAQDINTAKLKSIFENLQQIRDRIKHRCEKKVIA